MGAFKKYITETQMDFLDDLGMPKGSPAWFVGLFFKNIRRVPENLKGKRVPAVQLGSTWYFVDKNRRRTGESLDTASLLNYGMEERQEKVLVHLPDKAGEQAHRLDKGCSDASLDLAPKPGKKFFADVFPNLGIKTLN